MLVKFRRPALAAACLSILLTGVFTLRGAAEQAGRAVSAATPPLHATTPRRLIVRNAMVIYGNARPPYGPVDIVVENGIISYVEASGGRLGGADATIDATGKYVMPGIVNTHMHWHEERQPGMAQPIQYERNLYLASGVTTVREVGGDFEKSKRWQAESHAHTVVSPRILVYPVVSKGQKGTQSEIRAWIRDIKQKGADGLKIIAMDRDQLEATLDEAHTLGLRTTTHIEAFFRPSLDNHGSYFLGWTSTQEARWKQQYRIWMDVLQEFGRKGGLITTGDDAGYIYSMYGFGISRELELQEEAGFQPLEVLEHATWNGARMLGLDDRLGKVREGFLGDLLVVNGNPLDNLKLLNPYGTDVMVVNGKPVSNHTPVGVSDHVQVVRGGGIEWTIKDGIPYHVPTLMREVKEMVDQARERTRPITP